VRLDSVRIAVGLKHHPAILWDSDQALTAACACSRVMFLCRRSRVPSSVCLKEPLE